MSLPPTADGFMYIETSGNNYGHKVSVNFEELDVIQYSNLRLITKLFRTGLVILGPWDDYEFNFCQLVDDGFQKI